MLHIARPHAIAQDEYDATQHQSIINTQHTKRQREAGLNPARLASERSILSLIAASPFYPSG